MKMHPARRNELQSRLDEFARANFKRNPRRSFLKKLLAGGALAVGALATPFGSRKVWAGGGSDLDVLNYALTLEHLEAAYYRDGLDIYTREDLSIYDITGFPAYDLFRLIRDHEREHVDALTQLISDANGTPVDECTYDFGSAYQNVADFVALAEVFENTGVSAYDGAIHLITNPDYQTAGATIATVEARHAAYLNLLNNDVPFPDAFDTPKDMDTITAAVSPFIVSCP